MAREKMDRKIWPFPVLCLVLVLLLNEWTFAALTQDRLVDLPGMHRNLLYYTPWMLRVLDLWGLFAAIYAWQQKAGFATLWKEDLGFYTTTTVSVFFLIYFSNPIAVGKFTVLRVLAILLLFLMLLRWVHMAWIRKKGRAWLPMKPGLAVIGLLSVYLFLEMGFLFVARSHQTMHTFASKIWFQRYWEENALGYRDATHTASDFEGKRSILFVGDSFTAGSGLEDPADRFTDVVGKKLGKDFLVANLGKNGLGPRGELEQLEKYPFAADAVVLVWYMNDIHKAAIEAGHDPAGFLQDANALRPGVGPGDCSYFFNFLSWMYPNAAVGKNYYDFLQAAYADPLVWEKHFADLKRIAEWAEEKQMKMGVVLFPWLRDVKGSGVAMRKLEGWLQGQNIPVAAMDRVFGGCKAEDLIVNANDGHPSKAA
ncbi:MAG: SGNH/GDSL hydrolase family protein, partial [Myxococcota bacterium]